MEAQAKNGFLIIKTCVTKMICCSISGQVLRTMIIFEKDWLSGLYSRNSPDGCLYGDNHQFSLSERLYGQGTLCELV